MRSVGSTIINAERDRVLIPRHAATSERRVVSFGAPTVTSNSSLATDRPVTILAHPSNAAVVWAVYAYTGGTQYLKVLNPTTSSDWAMTSTSATSLETSSTPHALKSGLITDAGIGGDSYLYTAQLSSSTLTVRRATITSATTNAPSISLSTFATFSLADFSYTANSGAIWRIEAIQPISGGQAIIAFGVHNFSDNTSTITFKWMQSSTKLVSLNTMLKVPFNEDWSANNFYTNAFGSSYVCAYNNGGQIIVIANAGTLSEPKAVGFTVTNGVESPLQPIIPSDLESSAVSILPTGLNLIGTKLFLTGRVIRKPATTGGTATAVSYDGYMVSTGDLDFSFGARNHYIQSDERRGTMFAPYNTDLVYYGGGESITHATSNSSVTLTQVNPLTVPLTSWSLSSASNGADSLTINAANATGLLDGDSRVDAGSVIKLESGQGAVLADIGQYGIDENSFSVDLQGRDAISIQLRDYGHKVVNDWASPIYGQILARQSIVTTMGRLSGFTVKTPSNGYVVGAIGMTHVGLNEPFVAFADAFGEDSHIQKATVTFDNAEPYGDNYHTSAFGFIFGATDDGYGNICYIPKNNIWDAPSGGIMTQMEVRKLNLTAIDPLDLSAENTGFNFTPRINNMLRSVDSGYIRTSAGTGNYAYRTTPAFVADTEYDFAMRKVGRKVWAYSRERDLSPSNASTHAHFTLLGEYEMPIVDYPQYGWRSSVGVALNTDVAFSTDWFAQGAYGDIKLQAMWASNLLYTAYTRHVATGDSGSPPPSANINLTSGDTNLFTVGMTVRIERVSGGLNYELFTVSSISSSTSISFNYYRSSTPATFTPDGGNFGHRIYLVNTSQEGWGYITSGNETDYVQALNGNFDIPIATGATKRDMATGYRGVIVSNDSTAGSLRYFTTDGIVHIVTSMKGDDTANDTWEAWDYPTAPIEFPRTWRIIGYGGKIYNGTMDDYGLPLGDSEVRLVKVDDEAIRYEVQSYIPVGVYPQDTQNLVDWTIVPAYYAPLAAANAGTTTLKNWRADSGAQPCDNLGDSTDSPGGIKTPAGLLVEVITRNNESDAGAVKRAYHVTTATTVQEVDATPTNTSYISLDSAYPHAIRSADITETEKVDGDLVVVSGRAAKLNGTFTDKTTHDATAPVVYLPTTGSGDFDQAAITVTNYAYHGGRYKSIEDAIKRVTKLTGMMQPEFRSVLTTPVTVETLSSTYSTLPLRETVSDFVLDLNAHIPAGNISTTPADSNRLYIAFRGNYVVSIQGWNTSAMINAGCEGGLRVGLHLTNSEISTDGSGDRWLESAPVIVGNYSLTGSYSGSGTSWTHTDAPTRMTNIRLAAIGSEIILEIEGQPVWTWHIETMNDGAGNSYAHYEKGAIQLKYAASLSTNYACNVQELCDEAANVFINKGHGGADVMKSVIGERQIAHRANTTGGITFSQFFTRDDGGTLQYNLLKDAWGSKDLSVFSHQEVIGKSSGEYIDDETVRDEGYSFNSSQHNAATSGANAELEARLLVRLSKEMAQQRTISGFGFIELQPEDKVSLQYSPAGDVPTFSATDFIITQMSLNADFKSVKGEYTLRRYISSV